MRRIALFLLLGFWLLASAQTPTDDEPKDASELADAVVDCIPADEAASQPAEQAEGEPALEPCVEPSPETFPEEEPYVDESADLPEDGPIDENDLPVEASVEEEFQPGDEISEDYPVPLPSDI